MGGRKNHDHHFEKVRREASHGPWGGGGTIHLPKESSRTSWAIAGTQNNPKGVLPWKGGG